MTNPTGNLVVPNLSPINVGANAQPTLVDIDGDGILDVLVNGVNTSGSRAWNYYASGTQYQASTFSLFNNATSLTFADIDGDGDSDAIGVAANGSLLYYRNDRRGQFTALTSNLPFRSNGQVETTALTSNNPFRNLLVSAGSQLTFVNGNLIATNPNGTIQQFSYNSWTRQWQTGGSFDFTGINLGANARPTFLDFDRDGDLDIVVGGADGKIRYYESFRGRFYQQSEKFNPFQRINNSNRLNASPTIVDIDGNGNLDLIVGKSDGTIEEYRDMSAAFYRPPRKAALFETPRFVMSNFGFGETGKKWTSFEAFPRHMADVNGDGKADIVAFGESAVVVALGRGDGTFNEPTNVLMNQFTTSSGWNSFKSNPRQLADVNGDGRADIVAFGDRAVAVMLGQANGTFGNSFNGIIGFTKAGGWGDFDRTPRQMADVNGDGRADIVGFGDSAVVVALGKANGTFDNPFNASIGFTKQYGWNSFDRNPRQLADVNGDGRADIVGFGQQHVFVALGQADGSFGNLINAFTGFTEDAGRWLTYNQFPRQMGDINGDGRADIVGFGEHGVFVALGELDGTFTAHHQYNTLTAFTLRTGRWTNFDTVPRQVADLNGDGLADVVGFGEHGVHVALNQTPQFSRDIDLLFELDFNASGQSIWGNSQAKYKYDKDYSISWDKRGSADASFGSIGGYTNGAFGVKYGYDVDFGSINANLPVQTWLDLPDKVQAGQTITMKSGFNLKETANFSTTAPRISAYFDFLAKLEVGASLTLDALGFDKTWNLSPVNFDQSFSLNFDTANSWSTGFGGKENDVQKENFSANYSEGKLIELEVGGIKSGTVGILQGAKTIAGNSDSTLLKANLDLDNLLARILKKIPKLRPVGNALEKLEGSVGGSVDVGLGTAYGYADWNLFDMEFANRLGLKTNLNLSADSLTGILTLEDGRTQNFTVGQDLTFNVGADLNGDGFINMSATVGLKASFQNRTSLAYQGSIEMEALSASGEIGLGELSAGGSMGPMWSYTKDIPGLNFETSLYNEQFELAGLKNQSFNFAVAVNNRA